jgi:cell division protein FtsB
MPRLHLQSLRPRVSQQTLSRWGGWLVLTTLLILAGTLLVGFVRMTWTEHQINQSSERQMAINETQRERNAELKGEAEYRESDVYAEQAAREQLGMAREGDTVLLPTVVLPPTAVPTMEPQTPAASSAPAAAPEDLPNYQRWWQALFPGQGATP